MHMLIAALWQINHMNEDKERNIRYLFQYWSDLTHGFQCRSERTYYIVENLKVEDLDGVRKVGGPGRFSDNSHYSRACISSLPDKIARAENSSNPQLWPRLDND